MTVYTRSERMITINMKVQDSLVEQIHRRESNFINATTTKMNNKERRGKGKH